MLNLAPLQDLQSDIAHYRAHYQKWQAEQRIQEGQRHRLGHEQAREAARLLKADYGLQKVWLFGSLLDPDSVHADSDIDLAVEGLALSQYCQAVGDLLCAIKDFSIDLVRVEDASESLRHVIYQNGLEL